MSLLSRYAPFRSVAYIVGAARRPQPVVFIVFYGRPRKVRIPSVFPGIACSPCFHPRTSIAALFVIGSFRPLFSRPFAAAGLRSLRTPRSSVYPPPLLRPCFYPRTSCGPFRCRVLSAPVFSGPLRRPVSVACGPCGPRFIRRLSCSPCFHLRTSLAALVLCRVLASPCFICRAFAALLLSMARSCGLSDIFRVYGLSGHGTRCRNPLRGGRVKKGGGSRPPRNLSHYTLWDGRLRIHQFNCMSA